MDKIIDLICGTSTDFTPQVLVTFCMFFLVLDCISSIARSVLKAGDLK